MECNEISNDLDNCSEGKLLKNHRAESIRIADKLFENAVKKRDDRYLDLFDGVYD